MNLRIDICKIYRLVLITCKNPSGQKGFPGVKQITGILAHAPKTILCSDVFEVGMF